MIGIQPARRALPLAFFVSVILASAGAPRLASAQTGSLPVLDPIADVTAPVSAVTDVPVHASDADGDVITFSTNFAPPFVTTFSTGPNDGVVRLTPASTDVGSAVITAVASDPLEGVDWATFTATIPPPASAPVAYAGGPYFFGFTEFDGTRSFDPEGSPLTYLWDFGDGTFGTGPTPVHSYPSSTGSYIVTLTVTDPEGNSSRGSTYAIVTNLVVFGTAFPSRSQPFLKVPTGRSSVCVQLQGPSLDPRYVDLSTVRLRTQGGEASAIDSKTALVGDTNHDGLEEIKACFRGEDLTRMLSWLPQGRSMITFELAGDLTLVGQFRATFTWEVLKTGPSLSARAVPNPIRVGGGALEFDTESEGPALVELYDLSGRLVRHVFEQSSLPGGHHRVDAEGGDAGPRLANGIYFYRVTADGRRATGKLVVAR